MLGSTMDLGHGFMELLVFSTMLGSTVASGDDFLDLFVFSAMLGSTVAPGDDALLGSTLDLQCSSRCFRFPGSKARDARHHGPYGPG